MKKTRSGLLVVLLLVSGCNKSTQESTHNSPKTTGVTQSEWIAFVSGRSGNGDIYALELLTGDLRLLVGSDHPEGSVRYNRIDDQIFYCQFKEYPGNCEITGVFENPSFNLGVGIAPAWPQTGEWIVYTSQKEGRENLSIAQIDGSEEKVITSGFTDLYPSWSPDDNSIVFVRKLDSGWDLYILSNLFHEPELQRITHTGKYVGHPSWSPNGEFIAYETLTEEGIRVAYLELDTKDVKYIPHNLGNSMMPGWSFDNQRLVFSGEADRNWDLWLYNLDTEESRRLTDHPGFDGEPVFVPFSVVEKLDQPLFGVDGEETQEAYR